MEAWFDRFMAGGLAQGPAGACAITVREKNEALALDYASLMLSDKLALARQLSHL